jgi:hypothetical protein
MEHPLDLFLAAIAALLLHPKEAQAKNAPFYVELPRARAKEKEYLLLALLAVFICVMLVVCCLIDPKITYLSLILSKIAALASVTDSPPSP